MRVTNATGYDEPRDSLSHDWISRLADWDTTVFPVPNLGERAPEYLCKLSPDLLILSGGDDLGVSPQRDATELALLKYAIEVRLPTFGVCRGLQLINTFFGGQLKTIEGHIAIEHEIHIAPSWQIYYGEITEVNSYHKLCVPPESLGPNLISMATDSTKNIEALQHEELPIAAVMWHPERNENRIGDRLLVEALTKKIVL